MGIFDWFRRKPETETRAGGFTAEVIAMREAYISGARGLAELTGTVQSCVGLWEAGMGLADVSGTTMLGPQEMAQTARSCALRGEALWLIRDGLVPVTDWDVRTRDGRPTAYRVSVPEAGGGRSETVLADEVLHVRIGADPAQPWIGQAPLRRASLTAGMLHALEAALRETFETAPLGSQIVHLPEGSADDTAAMRQAFRGKRGSVLIVEGTAQATAAGMNPALGQRPDDLSPNIERTQAIDALSAARESIALAFGVLPALLNGATTGPLVREAQRHLAQWQLQPLAALLAREASDKLATPVEIDVMRPLQAFDAGGRARAFAGLIQGLAQAKEAGIDPAMALQFVDMKGDQDG